jgi:hypothetical protein
LEQIGNWLGDIFVRDAVAALERLQSTLPEYVAPIEDLDASLWPSEPSSNVAPMITVGTREHGNLWLVLPDHFVAREFDGQYQITEAQKHSADSLVQLFADLDFQRAGILYRGGHIEEPRLTTGGWIDLDTVLDSAPFEIEPNGTVRVPDDFDPPPYLDDILGPFKKKRLVTLESWISGKSPPNATPW